MFLSVFDEISKLMASSSTRNSYGMLVALLLLLRIVLATSAHPRIALITQTFGYMISDMFHFLLIFGVIFTGFAMIATWQFGTYRTELGSLPKAMCTQFDAILGPPGMFPIGDENLESEMPRFVMFSYIGYATLFHCLCFFFLLNFLLAIIINAYTHVMDDIDSCVVEQDLLSDSLWLIRTAWKSWRNGWPSRVSIYYRIGSLNQKVLNKDDLWWECYKAGCESDGKWFKSQSDAERFFEHYENFEFLVTEEMGSDLENLQRTADASMDKVEQITRLLGTVIDEVALIKDHVSQANESRDDQLQRNASTKSVASVMKSKTPKASMNVFYNPEVCLPDAVLESNGTAVITGPQSSSTNEEHMVNVLPGTVPSANHLHV
eukprot:gnl/TRDRNA2_/TRDRNA2_152852_c0_seq1.p1 gnl/TRDRNA2_/TRDRNA2_152852_c0~~gnl/TRDRNA2_/TRDRNA2_152852_c0_seq1.p1  ORF type:complete len:377 (-),score=34.40 gnl/TRDRNA2_/TRDRNA2_152852_c0_seq1:295-1425(-)